jgi:hypothetical protein
MVLPDSGISDIHLGVLDSVSLGIFGGASLA